MSKTQKTRLRRLRHHRANRCNLQKSQKRMASNVNVIRQLEAILTSK